MSWVSQDNPRFQRLVLLLVRIKMSVVEMQGKLEVLHSSFPLPRRGLQLGVSDLMAKHYSHQSQLSITQPALQCFFWNWGTNIVNRKSGWRAVQKGSCYFPRVKCPARTCHIRQQPHPWTIVTPLLQSSCPRILSSHGMPRGPSSERVPEKGLANGWSVV